MNRLLTFILCICLSSPAWSQKLIQQMPVKNASILQVDETGHVYLIHNKRTITKYNIELENLMEFRATKNGEIKILDVNNPMEIIFFQPSFNRMTILDRLFSQKFELDFNQYNHQNISCVAQSLDGHYWLYDVLNAQLVKMNKQFLEVTRSNDLRLSQINDFEPTQLEEYQDGILAFENGNGYILFDRYANVLYSNFEIGALKNIHLLNQHWIEIYIDEVVIKNFTRDKTLMNFRHDKEIIDVRVFNDKFIVLDSENLLIYSLDIALD